MTELDDGFRNLRVSIESMLPPRAIIAVTSVLAKDGKSYVACGIGRAFAEAGYATLLVDGNDREPGGVAEQLGIAPLKALGEVNDVTANATQAGAANLFALSLATAKFCRALSLQRQTEVAEKFRSAFAVTVIDTASISTSNGALEFARLADGTFIAARANRVIRPADRELTPTLSRIGVTVLGVVLTEGAALHSAARDPGSFLPSNPKAAPASA